MEFTSREFKIFFHNIVDIIEEEKDYLCELDRKIGDGDHGVTMSIGWQAVKEKLMSDLSDEEDIAKINLTVGKTFLNAVGSSVGPLYATGFMRGAKQVKNKTILNEEDLINYWIAFTKGIKERGQSDIGDKTMVDTLAPFARELESKYNITEDFYASFESAVIEAKKGMESTKDLISKKGRSSRLGERSIGAQDPGATSSYLILQAFLSFIKEQQSQAS
ncbi:MULTISPECIES: dihydroxyacetone kinase subunit DhaL [Oceanobacillus]|uniref:Dihydroxyacetone kinase subunit L n=1 Tax=Oceanobacillus kimchii TaxID=746691 RepID=A0ABQ5TIQ6_9BACI|nr:MULTISPECIES: dihydroxyacetone kinase subunit DhaL [Oceanobacillus]MBT2598145.1 dihydroxyacetone kinase subunit L [Oceanobacillus sp. ISL-74]MBT2651064.1 dihydroxyacetone kinase subunit L [Oceanobacillus sp. ISL-73]MCT1575728.1 dihydroxyacetone kinase subunit DhaL [Oceanobacillus kimchii]MCT2135365.1 dihydroxyacetone kinase subunit DhaL [Oceanobacillus kimchii]OEH55472.1 dihydroxyacetone kinase [Oceanobacillus sp. E9]